MSGMAPPVGCWTSTFLSAAPLGSRAHCSRTPGPTLAETSFSRIRLIHSPVPALTIRTIDVLSLYSLSMYSHGLAAVTMNSSDGMFLYIYFSGRLFTGRWALLALLTLGGQTMVINIIPFWTPQAQDVSPQLGPTLVRYLWSHGIPRRFLL